MTHAPERITAWVTRNGVTKWEAGSLQFPPDTEVEYIRADLACPKVKLRDMRHDIASEVFRAMKWASDQPAPDRDLSYTQHGNSVAEYQARATADRILSALEAGHE